MDWTGITEGLKSLSGMVTSAFDFFGKGKLDATKAAEMSHALEMKIKELESSSYQIQIALTEKMMVAAPWRAPLALVSGSAVVLICVFNCVARSVGWGAYSVEITTPEFLLLLGFFVFVASGDVDVLKKIFNWIGDRISKKPDNKEK